jgi:hypothetical protein
MDYQPASRPSCRVVIRQLNNLITSGTTNHPNPNQVKNIQIIMQPSPLTVNEKIIVSLWNIFNDF